MYLWSPTEDPQEMYNITLRICEGKEYAPESSIGHLQLLFALLQFGRRRYVDPTAFILSLGLDTSTQQDAQVRLFWLDTEVSDSRVRRVNTVNTKD
jgi:ubiquitin carboxyl-terminal hydrolase 48